MWKVTIENIRNRVYAYNLRYREMMQLHLTLERLEKRMQKDKEKMAKQESEDYLKEFNKGLHSATKY